MPTLIGPSGQSGDPRGAFQVSGVSGYLLAVKLKQYKLKHNRLCTGFTVHGALCYVLHSVWTWHEEAAGEASPHDFKSGMPRLT